MHSQRVADVRSDLEQYRLAECGLGGERRRKE
jgi:hypothetical protein